MKSVMFIRDFLNHVGMSSLIHPLMNHDQLVWVKDAYITMFASGNT